MRAGSGRSRFANVTFGLVVMTALVAVGGSVAEARVKPHTPEYENHWGYATVRFPVSAGYTISDANSRDDLGTDVTFERTGVGQYKVTFTFEAPASGNLGVAFATAISATGVRCSQATYGAINADLIVEVSCYDRNEQLADSKFSVNYLLDQTQAGRAAYMFMGSPSSTNSTPLPDFTFNSSGGANATYRPSIGDYLITLPGVGSPGGNVLVNNAVCHAVQFRQDSHDELVEVRCHDVSGPFVDTFFGIAFTDGQGLKPPASSGVAYLTADRPTAGHYTPDVAYRYQSNGMSPSIDRIRKGRYIVTLAGMSGGGAAQITPYVFATTRCTIAKMPDAAHRARIHVDCQAPDGTPKDAKFGLQYTNSD